MYTVSNQPASSPFTLYARYEPTTDSATLASGVKGKRDVCLYSDQAATQFKGRFPWHYTGNPNKRSKTCMLNCSRWHLIWLDDLK
jgi:hypothetical protein